MNSRIRLSARLAWKALLAAGVLGMCLSATGATNALSWVPAGSAGSMQYYVDAETVRIQGPIVHYRLFGAGFREGASQTSVEAEVGADCAGMRRVAYVTTTRRQGVVHTATQSWPEAVLPSSQAGEELATACQIAGTPSPWAQPDAEQVVTVRQASGASTRRTGTGFAVTREVVVTNNHVVEGCAEVRVVRNGTAYAASVVAADAGADLAALAVGGPPMQSLDIAGPRQDLGESIMVLGYPLVRVLGSDLRVTTGIVSALTGVGGDAQMMQVSAAVQSGNSGGPVLDDGGAVAGVVSMKLDLRMGAENVTFAIRTQPLRGFLAANGVNYRPAPNHPANARTTAQVVRKAAPSVFIVQCA